MILLDQLLQPKTKKLTLNKLDSISDERRTENDYDHKASVRGFTSGQNLSSENPKPTSGQEPFPV